MSFFNFGDQGTPKRPSAVRSPPVVPFCTSPSQLEEFTLEHDSTFSNTMGLRSPGVPMRGRSVKEFEEQLTSLKKENFNLKLRIYFLEEKMGTNFTLDKDNIVKKFIELQVDYANLRKEMEEKQELLCQAVKAMELEDEEHKKYIAEKEDQLGLCQQEIEDLRVQLQLHLEKENNASFQFVIGQTETFKTRCENMQKEIQAKDEIIKNLHQENESINAKISTYTDQIKDVQEKLDATYKENQNLSKKIISETRRFEELATQFSELKRKYNNVKVELEREHKRSERVKSAGESRVRELEDDNEKLKTKLRESQAKLEAALMEIRKNQNLAVSKSPNLKSNKSQTDVGCISVQDPTAPAGTPQKDTLHVQVVSSTTTTSGGSTVKSSSSTSICSSPSSPDKYNNVDFEEMLASASNEKILSVIHSLKQDYDTQRQKLFKLKTEQFKACEIIKNMMESRNKANDEIKQYQVQIKNLEKELESVVSKPTSDGESALTSRERAALADKEKSLDESKTEDMEVVELYKTLTAELEAKVEVLEATLKEKDIQMQTIREQYDDIFRNLQEKEHKISELEFELYAGQHNQDDSFEKGDSASEKRSSFYRKELEEKNKEIEKLNVELKKCSCYLQEIVNKELWDKNKEIEKLHSRQVNSPEILKLRKDLTGKEQQLKVLKDKISELGLDLNVSYDTDITSPSKINHIKSLQEELKACRDERDYFMNKIVEIEDSNQSEMIEKLQAHADSLKTDLDKSEKLRKESNEVCTLLGSRLEELAVFLDSLLKQKSILGFLGIQKERKLREIINTSLDLSKSFNMSLVFNPDQSLAQLTNITSILNGSAFRDLSLQDDEDGAEMLSIVPGNVTLTYQSHLYRLNKKSDPDSEEVISALREQIVNLKSELKLRDNELNRFSANSKPSETDEELMNRSFAKVYVTPQKNNTTSTTLKYQSDCASESEGWSEPDRTVSRARIGLNQTGSSVKAPRVSESTDDDNFTVESLLHNKSQEADLQQEIANLKAELLKKTEQLEAAELKLLNAVSKELYEEVKNNFQDAEDKIIAMDKLRAEAENRIAALKAEVDNLTKATADLNAAFLTKDEKISNITNLLEAEKTESRKISSELEEVVEKSKEDKIMFENKEKDFKELENQLRKDVQDLAVKLEEEQRKFKEMEVDNVEKIKQIEENYSKNYIHKSEVEPKLQTIDKLIQELDNLNEMVKVYEETIHSHEAKEQQYNTKISEYQEKFNCLRKDLDITTLEYSESVLEKTKLANEKASLEQEISRYRARDKELKQQINEIRSELFTKTQSLQQEVSLLQKQKAEFQMKISVLESNNAELHNRFVRLQVSRPDLSATMPNLKYHSGVSYSRQFSHPSFSSEDNLEECSGYNVNASTARNRQPADGDRQEANASPDLGIESDQGRFSSLEMHGTNITRPLLQTIELTETMNNMLDGENNSTGSNCGGQHCCQRTLEIANENNDLKRKLLRMRRALEETANQLNLANQRKKEVEKTICKQIHKTSQVLRKAKANLDSGSESDMLRM